MPKTLRLRGRPLLAALLMALVAIGAAACEGGYDGPPETNLNFERSHGKP